jgi:hypothetical protein
LKGFLIFATYRPDCRYQMPQLCISFNGVQISSSVRWIGALIVRLSSTDCEVYPWVVTIRAINYVKKIKRKKTINGDF